MGWIVDVVIVLCLIIGTAISAKTGIIKCLYSAFGTVVAGLLGVVCALPCGLFISSLFDIALLYWIVVIVMAVLFFILFKILIKRLAKWLTKVIERSTFLNVINKILGGLFGLISTLAAVTIIIVVVFLFVIEDGIYPNETVCEFLRSGFLANLIYKIGMLTV